MTRAVISDEIISTERSSKITVFRPLATRPARLRAYVSLTKPRVVGLVLFTSVCTAFVSAGGVPPWPSLALLMTTGFLTAGGAAVLNHCFDRDIDGAMQRTSHRPLVTGQVHPKVAFFTGSGMVISGLLIAAPFNLLLTAFLLLGSFTYVAVYTLWLKRRTPLNIVIGGLAGSCAVLGGWVSVGAGLTPTPLLLALLVFLWTPAHFWSLALARSDDYRRAGVPMLPVVASARTTSRWVAVHVAWTVAVSLWLQPVASFGAVYLAVALAAGFPFLWMAARLMRRPVPGMSWPLFKYSGIYLGLIFLAVLLDGAVVAS